MGLDMYLSKTVSVKNYNFKKGIVNKVTVTQNGKPHPNINPDKVGSVTEEVMYWRKANDIHNWFVKNVQDGNDDCKEYYVTVDNLKELLSTLKEAVEIMESSPTYYKEIVIGFNGSESVKDTVKVYDINDRLKEILPTTDGFFFGGTEYDDYYLEDCKETIIVLEKVLEENKHDSLDVSFYYSSSW